MKKLKMSKSDLFIYLFKTLKITNEKLETLSKSKILVMNDSAPPVAPTKHNRLPVACKITVSPGARMDVDD